MQRTHSSTVLAALLAMTSTFCGPTQAQVPEGSAVFATSFSRAVPGTPGLFLVPLAGGALTRVTGLPPELSFAGPGTFPQGAFSVSYREADGAIIVTTVASAAGPTLGDVHLFALFLNGTTVDPLRTRSIVLGNTTTQGFVINSVLPDGRILVRAASAGLFSSGPMANRELAIVDTSPSTPSVTVLPNTGTVGSWGGLACDPTGRLVYFPLTSGFPSPTVTLQRLDLVTQQICPIATWTSQVANGIVCDDDGTLYVSAHDPNAIAHHVHTVRPDGCNPAAVTSTASSLALPAAGLALDRASGRFVVAGGNNPTWPQGPQLNALSVIDRGTGAVTVLATAPVGGFGIVGQLGVAVNNALGSYGRRSDGQSHFWFENVPNPGGQPLVGNGGFSFTLRAHANVPLASVLALSAGQGSTAFAGVEILIDLGTLVTVMVPPGLSVRVPMPIPSDVALRDAVLTAQSVHVEASLGFAASRGLQLVIQ